MIRATDVSLALDGTLVLDRVGLAVAAGETVGVIGPNGSGKTTLLRVLHHALVPDGGGVRLDGRPIERMGARERARSVAVVAQEERSAAALTVAQMVLLGRLPHQRDLAPVSRNDRRIAASALERTGVLHLADRAVDTLSGGERQRVMIARALAQEPRVLLLDEPTNHLDIGHQHEILTLVRGLGVTCVVVLHDLNLAARYCDHLTLLEAGAVRCVGPPERVLTPRRLGAVYGVEARVVNDGDCLQVITGPRPPTIPPAHLHRR